MQLRSGRIIPEPEQPSGMELRSGRILPEPEQLRQVKPKRQSLRKSTPKQETDVMELDDVKAVTDSGVNEPIKSLAEGENADGDVEMETDSGSELGSDRLNELIRSLNDLILDSASGEDQEIEGKDAEMSYFERQYP